MKCESASPLLESYLDGELDRAAVDELESHLAGCPACRAQLGQLEELRGALRALPRQRAPAELRARLMALHELPARESPRVAPGGAWWKLAAAVLSGVAIGLSIGAGVLRGDGANHGANRGASGPEALLARDLLASHLRALAASSPVDVMSEDRHTVKPWFAGKIGESPPVIDPRSAEYPLLGGRIDYVGERRTAVIVYGHRKHVIDVYVAPGAESAVGVAHSQGYALTPCMLGGQSAWIVSDIDADSLREFAGLLGCGG
jgi:anti-sigma factor (TIGR02949 family)